MPVNLQLQQDDCVKHKKKKEKKSKKKKEKKKKTKKEQTVSGAEDGSSDGSAVRHPGLLNHRVVIIK